MPVVPGVVALTLLLALTTSACGADGTQAMGGSRAPAVETTAIARTTSTVVPGTELEPVRHGETRRPPSPEPAAATPGTPQRLAVPALGVDAPVVPITAPGGVLTPPGDPQVLGWWSDGAQPGAGKGSALVAGHTVHSGGGALDYLERLRAGDRIWVATSSGRVAYAVSSTVVLGKGELAQRATVLFDQRVPGRLVVMTCEDWNGSEYLSNVVVTADPVT